MNICFEQMADTHQEPVMTIFNHYIATSTSAFPESLLPVQFFAMLMKKSESYPAYALRDTNTQDVIGFCSLSAYHPFSSFRSTAAITYFITPNYTGQGLGRMCLEKLEADAALMGISHLVAEISSENTGSLAFHQKHGFDAVGELKNIGSKFGRRLALYLCKRISKIEEVDAIHTGVITFDYRSFVFLLCTRLIIKQKTAVWIISK